MPLPLFMPVLSSDQCCMLKNERSVSSEHVPEMWCWVSSLATLRSFWKGPRPSEASLGRTMKNSRPRMQTHARAVWMSEVSLGRTEVKQDHELLPEDLEQLVKNYKALHCAVCLQSFLITR